MWGEHLDLQSQYLLVICLSLIEEMFDSGEGDISKSGLVLLGRKVVELVAHVVCMLQTQASSGTIGNKPGARAAFRAPRTFLQMHWPRWLSLENVPGGAPEF